MIASVTESAPVKIAALSVLAFPPFGPGALIVPGTALFLLALRHP